jgi:hypothetical protein
MIEICKAHPSDVPEIALIARAGGAIVGVGQAPSRWAKAEAKTREL